MSQCKIYLENYSGVYYAGSEIRGRIECYFDDETSVRGIKIRIKCKENNSWSGTETYTDPSDNRTKTRHITYTGDNTVFYVEQMLFGSDSGTRELSRGRHVYPFSYTLPHDLPTTYNGPHGSISYKVKAIVDRPMRTDYEDDFIFVVQAPIDFNKMSSTQDITTYSDSKSVCCWCCTGGDISMDVELPKIGFVAGEKVPFKVTICNLSNSNVDNLKVKLTKTITYTVTSPSRETKDDVDTIVAFNEHGVGAHGEHTYNLELAIPSYIEVPNFARCELFKVSYELKVTAEMGGCTLDLDISAWDIQMGHIQCASVEDNKSQNYNVPTEGGFVPPAGAYAPPQGGYAPPSAGYAPPSGGYAPPSGGYAPPQGGYAPPQGGYAPPPGGYAPPPGGYALPPPGYAPPGEGYAPPPGGYSAGGFVPPPGGYPPEKGVFPGGHPSAPSPSVPTAPADDSKSAEAARSPQSGPSVPEMPPPSYSQVQQNMASYPPQ